MRINEIDLSQRGIFYNGNDAIKALEAGERVLYVKGDLNLRQTSVKLPDKLTVTGKLSLHKAHNLPNNLTVGTLVILNSGNLKIHSNTTIKDSLIVDSTRSIQIPDGFNVPGNLKLNMTGIRQWPNVNVGGSIAITNTYVEQLPKGLVVNGDLSIEATYIEQLPDDLVVKGDLDLLNSWVDKKNIPKTVRVDGIITGG